MLNWKLIWRYAVVFTLELSRSPAGIFFTIFFPILFSFLIQPSQNTPIYIGAYYCIFACYAMQMIMFQTLGMKISIDKSSMWAAYLKTLPDNRRSWLLGQILHCLLAGLCSFLLLTAVYKIHYWQLLNLNFSVFIGGLGFILIGSLAIGCLGASMGNMLSDEASRPIFTLCNLLLLSTSFMAHPERLLASASAAATNSLYGMLHIMPWWQYLFPNISVIKAMSMWISYHTIAWGLVSILGLQIVFYTGVLVITIRYRKYKPV
jgi:hypothetical protein